jgi:O-Antigen ligase
MLNSKYSIIVKILSGCFIIFLPFLPELSYFVLVFVGFFSYKKIYKLPSTYWTLIILYGLVKLIYLSLKFPGNGFLMTSFDVIFTIAASLAFFELFQCINSLKALFPLGFLLCFFILTFQMAANVFSFKWENFQNQIVTEFNIKEHKLEITKNFDAYAIQILPVQAVGLVTMRLDIKSNKKSKVRIAIESEKEKAVGTTCVISTMWQTCVVSFKSSVKQPLFFVVGGNKTWMESNTTLYMRNYWLNYNLFKNLPNLYETLVSARPTGLQFNPNLAAYCIAISGVILNFMRFQTHVSVFSIFITLLTQSRIVIAYVILSFWLGLMNKKTKFFNSILFIGFLAVGTLVITRGMPTLYNLFTSQSDLHRIFLFTKAWNAFRESPFFGVGNFGQYLLNLDAKNSFPGFSPNLQTHAHNILLEYLVTGGAFLFFFLMLLLICIIFVSWSRNRSAIFFLVCMLCFNFFDYFFENAISRISIAFLLFYIYFNGIEDSKFYE